MRKPGSQFTDTDGTMITWRNTTRSAPWRKRSIGVGPHNDEEDIKGIRRSSRFSTKRKAEAMTGAVGPGAADARKRA